MKETNHTCAICSKPGAKGATALLKWLGVPFTGDSGYAHPACISAARKRRKEALGPSGKGKAPAKSAAPVPDTPSPANPAPVRPLPARKKGRDLLNNPVPEKVAGWSLSIIEHGLLKAVKGKKFHIFPNMVHLNAALKGETK